MRDPKLSGRIINRIRESSITYTPKQQKAALLLRNKDFLEQRTISKIPPKPPLTPISLKERDKWVIFCNNWGIGNWWDGQNSTLLHHINVEPEVFYRDPLERRIYVLRGRSSDPEYCDTRAEGWSLEVANERAFILIKINPWTRKAELNRLWPTICSAKKKAFGYREREAKEFGRDLCWYDLHENTEYGRLSYEEIRRRWTAGHPSRKAIISGVKEIRSLIDRLTPVQPSRWPS